MQHLGGARIEDLAMVHGDVCQALSDNVTGARSVEQNTRIQELEAEVVETTIGPLNRLQHSKSHHKTHFYVTHILQQRS